MKVLFDQGTPDPLRQHLTQHMVSSLQELGWSVMTNGELLDAAEEAGYDVFITTDQNLRYQQNLANKSLAILVLLSTSWPRIRLRAEAIRSAIGEIGQGEYREISI